MANVLLGNLPTYTGDTTGFWIPTNDSGNTTTYKVVKENLIKATNLTKTEFDALVSANGLTPGAYYLISGVDAPLYGGTTILIQAATTNKLDLAGHGIFYNPKYLNSQFTPYNGFGIWNNYITLTMSSIVGTFVNGNIVTANNGATATYLAQGFFQWISGDWSTATSISNGAGATSNVSGGVSPSYAIGQDVIWGGKHWTNTSGAVGSADDKYTLSAADWTAVTFNNVDYNVVADVIHYDYSHDMIIRRKDKWDNDVDGTFQWFDEISSPGGYGWGNPIKDFQWGNGPEDFNTDDYWYLGVQGNYVKDSYLECINFIGIYLWFNILTQQSTMYSNITDETSYISWNTLNNYSYFNNNTLINTTNISSNILFDSDNVTLNNFTNTNLTQNQLNGSASITNNKFIGSTQMRRNILNNVSQIVNNTINNNSYINNNVLINGSYIDNNTLTSTAEISGNELNSSNINNNIVDNGNIINNDLNFANLNNNTLTIGSSIQDNKLNVCQMNSNTLTNSSNINNNRLINCSIGNNTLSDISRITSNTITTGEIRNNTLTNSSFIFNNTLNNYSKFDFSSSGTLISKTISNIEANYANATFNISAATIIYGDYSKQIFTRQDGTVRLGYYNNSDVFTVVNVNA